MLHYYRFFNKQIGKHGTVFAVCDKHIHLQHVPHICTLEQVNLLNPPAMLCSFCEDEKWSKQK